MFRCFGKWKVFLRQSVPKESTKDISGCFLPIRYFATRELWPVQPPYGKRFSNENNQGKDECLKVSKPEPLQRFCAHLERVAANIRDVFECRNGWSSGSWKWAHISGILSTDP